MIYRASRLLLIITLIAIGYEYPSATGKQVMDEPRPTKAVEGIIKLFDRFPIVALGEMLWNRTQHDFIVSLIEHPGFPDKVNYIVVEFGSARYQDIMDKYIAGETVPHTELRQAWRNTTQPTTVWDVALYERFFATVRAVNQKLPKTNWIEMQFVPEETFQCALEDSGHEDKFAVSLFPVGAGRLKQCPCV
jgi:uncharacterized iron-regulated protein